MTEELLTRGQVVDMLREKVEKADSHEKFASDNYFSTSTISQTLSGRVGPGTAILDALGLEKIVLYRAKI